MSAVIWNLIEINVVVLMLFLAYIIVRKWLTFKLRRGFLLSIPIIAVITTIVKSLFDLSSITYAMPIININPIVIGDQESGNAAELASGFSFMWLYVVIAVAVGMVFLLRLSKLSVFFAKNSSETNGKYRIYRVDGKMSFSFFNRIQIAPNLNAQEQKIVLEHEKVHADKMHSLDTIIFELFHVVFWFNPVLIFIKRECINLHEYEVDAQLYEKHKVNYIKFLVNHALGIHSAHYLLTSRFYNGLTLKKRIKTMKTKHQNKAWLLGVIPLIAILASITQCTKDEKITDSADRTENIEIAVPEKIVAEPDEYPKFAGGEGAMVEYIIDNVNYPKTAAERGVEGTVFISFIVSKKGGITQAVVKQGVDADLDAEALRVINAMPDWTPGIKDGKNVAVEFTLPIQFVLS